MLKALKYFVLTFALSLGITTVFSFMLDRAIHTTTYAGHPAVIVDVKDESLVEYAPAWQREIARRFPNAVAILCHGGTIIEGQWLAKTDWKYCQLVSDVVKAEQVKYPGRTVVILCCDGDHIQLHGLPNVYQALNYVYCVPDRAVPAAEGNDSRLTLDGTRADADDAVGNIFEFVPCE